jgi:hypothetical protein
MSKSPLGLALVLLSVLLLAAACGSEDKDKEQAGKACGPAPAPLTGTPSLPSGFPKPSDVTYTSSKKEGPTSVVGGFLAGDIDAAFNDYENALKGASGYTITHDEHEEDDAEVNFAGHGQSGQVKLLQGCKDRTTVTITSRPQ